MDLNLYEELMMLSNRIVQYKLATQTFFIMANIQKEIQVIKKMAQRFKTAATEITRTDLRDFVKIHFNDFFQIYDTMLGEHYNLHVKNKSLLPNMRSIVDIIFNAVNIKNPVDFLNYMCTIIFEKFIQGITYFTLQPLYRDNNKTEHPLYHRPLSCGSKTQSHTQKFEFQKGKSQTSGEHLYQHIMTCYIERTIYDDIYNKMNKMQNISHLKELDILRRLCFDKYKSIPKIKVSFKPNTIIPIKLVIDYELYHSETFSKPENGNIVKCIKRFRSQTFTKTQSFAFETSWTTPEVRGRPISI